MAANPSIDPELLRLASELGAAGFLSLPEEKQERLLSAVAAPSQDIIEERCRNDALYWLTNFTATENPQYTQQGLPFRAPFPTRAYFALLFEAFANYRRLMVPKSRELMTTWAICGFCAHRGQFFQEETVFQSLNEDKAKEGVEYVRQLIDNQHDALKRRHPLKSRSTTEIAWADGGRFVGIPAGADAIRAYHPTRFILDEAAHTPGAQESWDAAHPVSPFLVAISTAAPGWFEWECQRGTE